MSFHVGLPQQAEEDLLQLHDFLWDRDEAAADRALDVITDAWEILEKFPFTCRKAAEGAHGSRLRELIISFGSKGYVALFEIDDATSVTV